MNDYAWLPSKMRYNDFSELRAASTVLKSHWPGGLQLGKSDFKSAFKTLPPSQEQRWLCYSLVFNPALQRHQVVPLYSQAFGSLGAVVAWYRTAMAVQHIMTNIFRLPVMIYVDDCFWLAPSFNRPEQPSAQWIQCVFEYVTQHLLGWSLDPDKSQVGDKLTILGLEIEFGPNDSRWALNPEKAAAWAQDIELYLQQDRLLPAEASKLCGRLSFLNSHIFGKLGRALLRPIIWRQGQLYGGYKLTKRLAYSLRWFHYALRDDWVRILPYTPENFDDQAILYSDAESNGNIAGVLIYKHRIWYQAGPISQQVRNLLQPRKTQIIAYELLAAISAIVMANSLLGDKVAVRHFIDNKPSRSCIIKASSKSEDLNNLVGLLWYKCGRLLRRWWAYYVHSKDNVADAPSRGHFHLLKRWNAQEVPLDLSLVAEFAESWMSSLDASALFP